MWLLEFFRACVTNKWPADGFTSSISLVPETVQYVLYTLVCPDFSFLYFIYLYRRLTILLLLLQWFYLLLTLSIYSMSDIYHHRYRSSAHIIWQRYMQLMHAVTICSEDELDRPVCLKCRLPPTKLCALQLSMICVVQCTIFRQLFKYCNTVLP